MSRQLSGMDLRQLIQLKRKGLSNRKVVQALGVSRYSVNAYVQAFEKYERRHDG